MHSRELFGFLYTSALGDQHGDQAVRTPEYGQRPAGITAVAGSTGELESREDGCRDSGTPSVLVGAWANRPNSVYCRQVK